MSKIISFEYEGAQYLNYDIDNLEAREYLTKQIGSEKLEKIISAYIPATTEQERLEALESAMLAVIMGGAPNA